MRGVSLLVAVVSVLGMPTFSAAEVPVRSQRSLQSQFDSYVEMLQKEVVFSKAKENKQKFALLNHALMQMKVLRIEMEPLAAEVAAPMDTLIAALGSLPSQRAFKKKNCSQYSSQLPQDPAAQPAVDFLQTLCN